MCSAPTRKWWFESAGRGKAWRENGSWDDIEDTRDNDVGYQQNMGIDMEKIMGYDEGKKTAQLVMFPKVAGFHPFVIFSGDNLSFCPWSRNLSESVCSFDGLRIVRHKTTFGKSLLTVRRNNSGFWL